MHFPRLCCRLTSRGLQTSSPPILTSTASSSLKLKSNLARLRKKTGYSMSLCKQALETAEDDVAKAEHWLKEQALSQGWAKANKLEGRNTTQGLLGLLVSRDHAAAAMVELNCETEFVATNVQFHELLNEVAKVALRHAIQSGIPPPSTVSVRHFTREDLCALKTSSSGRSLGCWGSLADLVALNIGLVGENIVLRRGVSVVAGEGLMVGGVTHPSGSIGQMGQVQYGRYGAVMAFERLAHAVMPKGQTEATMARQLCQHIIGINPARVGDWSTIMEYDLEPVNAAPNAVEKIVVKPAYAAPKTVEKDPGSSSDERSEDERAMEREAEEAMKPTVYREELIHQEYLVDPSRTVGEVLMATGLRVKDFVRFELGQNRDD